jgi:protein gp37
VVAAAEGREAWKVFVNSMSDLFHEGLTTDEIAAIFGVMAASERHTFQVLTKRAQRMCSWFEQVEIALSGPVQVVRAAAHALWPPALDDHPEHVNSNKYSRRHFLLHAEAEITWPLPNVWLGVSVENQRSADDRIPNLIATPAAVRWLSVEPMLGPVQIPEGWLRQLSWIVIGGESGPGARPFNLAWARELVKACKAVGVPVFMKQLGAVPVVAEPEWREAWKAVEAGGDIRRPGVLLSASNKNRAPEGTVPINLHDKKGADPLEWPEDLRVREYPAPAAA